MAAHWWRAIHVLVGPHRKEIIKSLIAGFVHEGLFCYYPRTCRDKHWLGFSILSTDLAIKSVCQIGAKVIISRTEANLIIYEYDPKTKVQSPQ